MWVGKEELSSFLHAAFDLGFTLWGGHEMAASSALIEFNAIDIDTSAGELAGEVVWNSLDADATTDVDGTRRACS